MDSRPAVAILGGSGGLGEAVCLRVAQDATITIGYRTGIDKAQKLVDTITSKGGKATAEKVNILDPTSVREFFERTKQTWNRLDAIISVIGPPFKLGPIMDFPDELFKGIIETDVFGSFNVVKQGIPVLRAGGSSDANILLFLTCAVPRALDYDGLSYVPKKCVEGIVRQTARDAGPLGIRINGLAPGVIDAGVGSSDLLIDEWHGKVIKDCLSHTPLNRRGDAREVGDTAAFLISKQASYITGQILAVDGGYSA